MDYGKVFWCHNCGIVETKKVILVRGRRVESQKKCLRCNDVIERKFSTAKS